MELFSGKFSRKQKIFANMKIFATSKFNDFFPSYIWTKLNEISFFSQKLKKHIRFNPSSRQEEQGAGLRNSGSRHDEQGTGLRNRGVRQEEQGTGLRNRSARHEEDGTGLRNRRHEQKRTDLTADNFDMGIRLVKNL